MNASDLKEIVATDDLKEIFEILERIEDRVDEIGEKQERLEEAIANLSLPGSGYGIDQIDEL